MIAEDSTERLMAEGLIGHMLPPSCSLKAAISGHGLGVWSKRATGRPASSAVRCGGRYFTSKAAVARFIVAQSEPKQARHDEPTSKERRESIKRGRDPDKRRHQMSTDLWEPLPPDVSASAESRLCAR